LIFRLGENNEFIFANLLEFKKQSIDQVQKSNPTVFASVSSDYMKCKEISTTTI
jgi:hypothetical protein